MSETGFFIGKYGFKLKQGWIVFHDLKADAVWIEPPYDQAIFWIMSTRAGIEDLARSTTSIARLTKTTWADLGVKTRLFCDFDHAFCRHRDYQNWYAVVCDADWSTADHQIRKMVAGSETTLATEAVDLAKEWYWFLFETVGTELRSYRAPDPLSDVPETPTLTVTDTDIADGRFGVRHWGHGGYGLTGLFFFLTKPASKSIYPIKYFIVPIEGSGTEEDPFRPKMPQKIKIINRIQILDKKRFEILKVVLEKKGFADDEIIQLARSLGFVAVKHAINELACTWSALIPTRKGKPTDWECIVRIFNVKDPKVFDELRKIGAREIDREEAIKLALRKDDKLHECDLMCFDKEDEAKKKAKEYIEWRRTQFKVDMKFEEALYYVKRPKCW